LMYQTGITLNIMSLGGIALGVGMLVDNSIVVLEAVDRHKNAGISLFEAVYRGTKEVGMAVTASTLTTVAVFLPMIFVEGIAGQLFKDQALTITYSLLASLLAALTFLPMVLAVQIRKPAVNPEDAAAIAAAAAPEAPSPAPGRFHRVVLWLSRTGRTAGRFLFLDLATVVASDLRRLFRLLGGLLLWPLNPFLDRWERFYNRLNQGYPRLLVWSLDNKGNVIVLVVFLTVTAVALSFRLGAELIPSLTQGEFLFELRLPEGKPLEVTDRLISVIEKKVAAYPDVQTVFSSAGGSNRNQFARESHEENVGRLFVVMKNKRDKETEAAVIKRIRDQLEEYPELSFT